MFRSELNNTKVALIPYITAGDPDLSTTAEALKLLDSCGSDIIELGVPYSDPLADGPVIQAAAARALARGTNLDAIIEMLNKVVPQLSCPIALFTYYNPILKRGVEKFMIMVKKLEYMGVASRKLWKKVVPLEALQPYANPRNKYPDILSVLALTMSAEGEREFLQSACIW